MHFETNHGGCETPPAEDGLIVQLLDSFLGIHGANPALDGVHQQQPRQMSSPPALIGYNLSFNIVHIHVRVRFALLSLHPHDGTPFSRIAPCPSGVRSPMTSSFS